MYIDGWLLEDIVEGIAFAAECFGKILFGDVGGLKPAAYLPADMNLSRHDGGGMKQSDSDSLTAWWKYDVLVCMGVHGKRHIKA